MKKSERLNQELIFLSNKKSFKLNDLMQEFNISKRTALRDIQDLEAIGLSFYVESGRYGGYKLIKQKSLIPIYFDNAEITSIFFALKALNLVSDTPFEKSYPRIYQKLLATLPPEQQEYTLKLLDAVDYYHIPPVNISNNLTTILEAILNLKVLNIVYAQYELVKQQILAYNLFYRNGIWFCNALDVNTNVWAIYRCDYIQECNVNEVFKHSYTREKLATSLYIHEKSYKKIPFKCHLTSFGKELFLKDNYPGMYLEEIDNNIFILGAFNEKELHYMVHYLIGFGKNITIESPSILKNAYLKELENIIEKYRK